MSKELITRDQVIKTARLLAEQHKQAQPSEIFSDDGTAQQIWLALNQSFDEISPQLTEQSDISELKQLSKWAADQYLKLLFLLDDRKDDGFVRLSSASILQDQLPLANTINQETWVDTLSDLALMVIHLDNAGVSGLSNVAVNEYLEISGDYSSLSLLCFYKVIHAISMAQRLLQKDQTDQGMNQYRRFIQLAHDYSQPKNISVIVLQGVSGTGKTTVAREVARQLDAVILRTDVERKRLFGLSPLASSTSIDEDIYSPDATDRTYSIIKLSAAQLTDANIPVVIDGASLKQKERAMFLALADEAGVPAIIVKCMAAREILKIRITKRQSDSADASEARFELIDQQLEWEEPLTSEEKKKTIVLHTDQSDWEQQLQSALASHLN